MVGKTIMGFARNLKKVWDFVSEGYSEGSSPTPKRKRKNQTSRKRSNSSRNTSSRKPLTIAPPPSKVTKSSEDTSENITMETTVEPVQQVRDWSIDRIHLLAEGDLKNQFDAVAIAEEFDEWINIPEGQDEISYLALEPEDWTEDQEIDTI